MAKGSPFSVRSIDWPEGGVVLAAGYEDQPRGTCADAQNVRPWDPATGQKRGAQRPGAVKYCSGTLGSRVIQCIDQLVYADTSAPSLTGTSTRASVNLAVAEGYVYTFTAAGSVTSKGLHLSTTMPFVASAQHQDKMYFCDGTNYRYYDLGTGSVSTWTASAGSMPANGANVGRLMCLWAGRIVIAGIVGEEHNWHLSALDDPTDWDTAPAVTTETQAASGNTYGESPDVINTLIPFSDDLLLFGCDHSIWRLTGNPVAGGRLDQVSGRIGMAWGKPWCMDPSGGVYFYSSRSHIYRLDPGGQLEDISDPRITPSLESVNLDSVLPRLAWDDRVRGLHVFLTPLTVTGSGQHWFWDSRTDSWWKDVFGDHQAEPRAVCVLDADDPDDRKLVFGGRDGYIRCFDDTAKADDTSAISSYVLIGPIRGADDRIMLQGLQVVLGAGSDDVAYAVQNGIDAETAEGATALITGTASGGKNYWDRRRVGGHAMYIKLSNSANNKSWSLEKLWLRLRATGGPGARLMF